MGIALIYEFPLRFQEFLSTCSGARIFPGLSVFFPEKPFKKYPHALVCRGYNFADVGYGTAVRKRDWKRGDAPGNER